MGKFEFNGKSTEDLGLIVQTRPTPSFPQRDMSSTHVPGRNGDFYIDNKSYKNIDKTYSLAKIYRMNENDCFANAEQILAWLTSANGKYAILKDSYDSSVYRKAMFNMSGSFSDIYGEAMTFQVTFNCKPQRFLITGDNPVNLTLSGNFNKKTTSIENSYHYESLPMIKISGIDAALENSDEILMLTIKNGTDILASTTISKLGVEQGAILGSINIDSENQEVRDDNNKDRSYCVGLNGLNFPVLRDGINEIEISKYEMETYSPAAAGDYALPTYDSLIKNQQEIVQAVYRSQDDLIEINQDRHNIKSWNSIIISKQVLYRASSLKAYVEQKAQSNETIKLNPRLDDDTQEIVYDEYESGKYDFVSMNTVLDNVGEEYRFVGTFDQIAATAVGTEKYPTDWLALYVNSGKLMTKARIAGFYLSELNDDKKIKYYAQGASLGEANPNKTNIIRWYPITNATDKELAIDFEDMPDWLDFDITYETTAPYSPIQVNFYLTKPGYYWKDKTGLFGKASWNRIGTDSEKQARVLAQPLLLDSFLWDSGKKAFVSKKGLLPSTNTATTYMYCEELPQYDDIVTEILDEDGEVVSSKSTPAPFTISASDDLNTVTINTKNGGFYKINIGNKNEDEIHWSEKSASTNLGSCKGTEAFEVAYLESIPDYSEEENFPDWLDPTPRITDFDKLKPQSISFKIKQTGFYKQSKVNKPEELTPTWVEITDVTSDDAKITFTRINGVESYKVNYTVIRIDEIPEQLDFDRQYLNSNGVPIELPDWLEVKYYETKELTNELVDDEAYREYITNHPKKEVFVRFMVGAGCGPSATNHVGYYKWDNNTVWQRKEYDSEHIVNNDLLATGIKDSTTMYYFDTIPRYSDFDLFDITPKLDSTGNPVSVEFTTKIAGYFRVNSNSNWTWYEPNQKLHSSKISEANTIRYLKEIEQEDPTDEDPLANIAITIIPRWWML